MTRQPPAWVEISVDLPASAHEAVSGYLFELGCEGLITEGSRLKAYLALPQDLDSIQENLLLFLGRLSEHFPEVGSPALSVTPVMNGDWSERWRRFFHSEKATPGLLIVPVWESPPRDWKGELILMDPGPAFGTGKHETTRMCLRSMERVHLQPGWSMLDVGTGSGILAMYGAKLGAGRILALDIDPEALRWAERNIGLNRLAHRIELTERPVNSLEERFNLLTANLTVGPVLDLLPCFARLLHPGGWLILSGILREQIGRVREGLREQDFLRGKIFYKGEWACVLTKNPTAL